MTSKDLGDQAAATYRMLRLGLAVLAFGFPLVLWIVGEIRGVPLAGSLSAYYHASKATEFGQGVMRNEFVGILFAISGILLVYQGYSKLEDYALNLAGVLVVGVALFPMAWPATAGTGNFSVHGAFAILFFVAIAYVCIFRAGDTLPLIKDETVRQRYFRTYRALGIAMVALPLAAWALLMNVPDYTSVTFFVELAAIYVFAIYWVVKSHEASKTGVDRKAGRGLVHGRPHGLSDALRPIPVTEEAR